MRSHVITASIVALLIGVGSVVAAPIRETIGAVTDSDNATVIDAATCAATRWTGWIKADPFASIAFEMTTVDGDDNVTAFTMRCEESMSSSTTTDAGADLCCRSISGGTETYSCPCSKSYNPTNGGHWSWKFDNLNMRYVNCAVDCAGVQEAGDTITAVVIGEK